MMPASIENSPASALTNAVRSQTVTIGDIHRIEAVFGPWERLRAVWADVEADAPLATPYQSFAWSCAAYAQLHAQDTPCVIVGYDKNDRPVVILPLAVSHGRVRQAEIAGHQHANFKLPLLRRGVRLGDSGFARLLDAAAELMRADCPIDLFAFGNAPFGPGPHFADNPIATLPHQLAPDIVMALDLEADPDAVAARAQSSHARKRLRKNWKALQRRGSVDVVCPASAEEAEAVLARFYGWKAARFARQGIPNVFDEDDTRRFLAALATPCTDGTAGLLRLYEMRIDGEPIAIFGAAERGGHISGMINTVKDGDWLKDGPGTLLIDWIIRAGCARGDRLFDLGAGEARYKHSICDRNYTLIDAFYPITPRGRLAALALRLRQKIKRVIKTTPLLWRMVVAYRRWRADPDQAAA